MTWARPAGPTRTPDRVSQARAAEQTQLGIEHHRAVRTVAEHAVDVGDCQDLLAMLGLEAEAGRREDAPGAAH
ncbi:hypothetical protein [Qaidamihabitans albus]|uniref:hypothetical protein n=1 Tax=Qaidamihabitans albus TaxID=2795733 RepID=UPI0018F161BF|nr:hypothetical protein [Qaidamihabitans albus]